MPSSRPKPDCLKPPNGVETRTELFELMLEHAGVERARDAQRAGAVCVQIEPDRPYGVSFAIRIASASSSNGISAATGPKTSSRATRSSFVASTSVHGNQKPAPSRRVAAGRAISVVVERTRDGLAVLRRRSAAPSRSPRRAGSPTLSAAVAATRRLDEPVVGAAARRGCASGRSSPGRRCRRRRRARRPRRARGRRRRRRRWPTCRRARA